MKIRSQTYTLASVIALVSLAVNHLPVTHARLGKSNIFIKESKDEQNQDTALGDEYIVIFSETVNSITSMSKGDISVLADELGDKYFLEKKSIFSDGLLGFSATNLTRRDLNDLTNEEGVLLVEKDGVISLDPMEDGDEDEDEEIQTIAFEKTKLPGNESDVDVFEGIIVAEAEVIPVGVQQVGWQNVEDNSDIMNKRVFVIDSGVSDPSNELNIDSDMARNFVSGENPQDWSDCHGHGTHIAGTIAAKKNGRGVVGVAAGATIVPIRVLDCTNNGRISDVVAAINYVAEKAYPGDVVNLSIGGPISQRSLDIAIERAAQNTGAFFVIAAGNGSTDAQTYSPARVQMNNVYTVCALSSNGKTLAGFSNYGRPPTDVCAPGSSIVSLSRYGGTAVKSGTSMAAPHVSGALLFGSLKTSGFARTSRDNNRYPIVQR